MGEPPHRYCAIGGATAADKIAFANRHVQRLGLRTTGQLSPGSPP
jgi:hypothetical protein